MALTKQQKELIALVALFLVVAVVWYAYTRPSGVTGPGASRTAEFKQINAQDFGQIFVDLEKAQSAEYKSAGRNIFVMGRMPEETTPGAALTKVKELFRPQGPMPPPPPPPPVLPWIFFGYGAVPANGPRMGFLKENDSEVVHIVNEGDLVLNHLRILRIGNERLDFEDINTGLKGSNNLEAPPAS